MSAELLDFDADHALKEAVCNGDAELLVVLLRKHGDAKTLRELHNDVDGTLHFHALNTMLVMARQPTTEPLVTKFAACARALRVHGAPVEHQHSPNGIAMVFLDSCWSTYADSRLVAEFMREYIDAGLLDANAAVPRHRTIGGLAPIACALKLGNSVALGVLLGAGADIAAALEETGYDDVIEYARSFHGPSQAEVTSVLAEHLMRERLRQRSDVGLLHDVGAGAARRRPAAV